MALWTPGPARAAINAASVLILVGYWVRRATALLAFGAVAVTIAVPEAVADWTGDELSGPGILLLSGAVLVGASALGLWLRSIRRTEAPAPG